MIYVELPRLGRVSAEVAWSDGRLAGCRFLEPISSGAVSAALLRALPDPKPLLAGAPYGYAHPDHASELSSRQKMLVLLSLALLAWTLLLGASYAGLHLLNA